MGELHPGGAPVLELRDLTVNGGSGSAAALAVDGLTLVPGIYGVIGPDDAGRRDLLEVLATLREPHRGQLIWRGEPVVGVQLRSYRSALGYVPRRFGARSPLTVDQALRHLARLYGLADGVITDRIQRVARALNLPDLGHPLAALSDGQRQQVGVAQALLHDPEVLVCHLPDAGLDHEHGRRLRKVLAAYGRHAIVVFSACTWHPVVLLNARLLVLARGELAYHGTGAGFVAAGRSDVTRGVARDPVIDAPDTPALQTAYLRWLDAGQPRLMTD